jgi:hypothetical protein
MEPDLHRMNYVESNRRREAEAQLRRTAEAKLLQSETELQKLRAEKAEWERKEDYLTTISKLKDRATDSEA